MADDIAVYETIAAALAEGRAPDLSSFDQAEVRTALQRVLGFPVARQNFLTWLNGRVRVLSGDRVSVEERPAGDQPVFAPGQGSVPDLPVRVVVQGESFAEPAVVRADNPAVQFPMRG